MKHKSIIFFAIIISVISICGLFIFKSKMAIPVNKQIHKIGKMESVKKEALNNAGNKSKAGNSVSLEDADQLPKEKLPKELTPEAWKRIVEFDKRGREANARIDFYGRVLDQYGIGVDDAKVALRISGHNEMFLKKILAGARRSEAVNNFVKNFSINTDESGFFSVINERGQFLRVISIEKEGYLSPPHYEGGGGSYMYKNNYGPKFIPDGEDPVLFKMWKKGNIAEDTKRFELEFKVNADNSPKTINLIDGKIINEAENADIMIKVKSDFPDGKRVKTYDWQLILQAINGGIVETNDDFLFRAPDSGYHNQYKVIYNKEDPKWIRSIRDKRFFFKGRMGSIYAALRLTAYTYREGYGYIQLVAIVNPDGSQNLEYNEKR